MAVLDMHLCRELLEFVSVLAAMVRRGEVSGIAVCTRDKAGQERVLLAGDYSDDKEAALRASMKMSWELTRVADRRS